jgi:ABC-type glycerol-3-phosphate transport system substrate-binding protein
MTEGINVNMFVMRARKLGTFLFFVLIVFGMGCTDKTIDNQYKKLKKVEQKTTINFIGHWLKEGKREDLVRNFAREYEFENQHIAVNLKFPEEVYFDQLNRGTNETFITDIVSQEIPKWDIIKVNGTYGPIRDALKDPDWAKKYLVDFSEIEEFRKGTRPELLNEATKNLWNGIIPGPILEGQFWTLWYNKKLASKLGIEIKQFGMTVDDFIGYLKATDEYNKKHPDDYIIPIYESFVWKTAIAIAFQMYSSLLTADEFLSVAVSERRLDAWEKTLEAVEKMTKYKPLNPKWRETEWGKTQGLVMNEECLFLANGSWMYNIWQGLDAKKTLNCVPAEFPSFTGGFPVYPWAYTITWAVLKKSPHKEEAIKFLLAMNKPSMADAWARYTKCPTGIKGSLSDVTFGSDQFENFAYHIQDKYKNKQYGYNGSGKMVLDDRFPQSASLYFTEVIEGVLTAKEAMNKIRQSVGR